jgi:hypothetical protein
VPAYTRPYEPAITPRADRLRYIDEQLAKGTPEGELNAAGATAGQMLDAHAHGAGNSPEFNARWERLVKTTEQHRTALRAEGHSTDEFDRNLNASVRRYLKEKGLTDAQIDAALAVSANPLDAVTPYIQNDNDAQMLVHAARIDDDRDIGAPKNITTAIALPSVSTVSPEPATAAPPDLADVMATFRAAGVTTTAAHLDAGAELDSQTVGGKPTTNAVRSN